MANTFPQFLKHEATQNIGPLPGWDASPTLDYPQQYVAGTHLYTWVEAAKWGKVSCLRKQHDGRYQVLHHRPSVQCANQ